MYVYCVEIFAHIDCYKGSHLLNPFATVLFTVCSAVTVKKQKCCLVKQFAMCLGVVAVLLVNGMDVFSVSEGVLLDRPCMVFHNMSVLCP